MWIAMSAAFAQDVEGYDAHAFALAPLAGGPHDGVATWRPTRDPMGTWSVRTAVEYADSLFVTEEIAPDGRVTTSPMVDDLLAVNVSARLWLTEDVSAAVSFANYLSSRDADGIGHPGLGDVRIAVPIRTIPTENGVGVDVIPYLTLATGEPTAFLGNSGVSGGVVLAPGWSNDVFSIDGNLGVDVAPSVSYLNLRGGSRAIAAAALGVALSDSVGAHLEANLRPALSRNDYAWSEAPGELFLSVGGRHGPGVTWNLGAAAPFTSGVGAAAYRVFAGIGFTAGSAAEVVIDPVDVVEVPAEPDGDADGVADASDMCPSEDEVVNAFADADGCPDLLGDVVFVVRDPAGKPVADARVAIGEVEQATDASGQVRLSDVMPGTPVSARVSLEGYAAADSASQPAVEGYAERTVTLAYVPVKVAIAVKNAKGAPIDALVAFVGPSEVAPVQIGADGAETIALLPGTWTVTVTAAKLADATQTLVVTPGAATATLDVAMSR